jgi:CheY-like chemotaxis protein
MHAPDQAMSAQDAVPLRILLVDDNEDAVRSVEQLLDYLGYAVKGVTHGREALAVGAAFAPDVVLLDLGMPDMSGYEIAAAIRAQTWGARVRIVALTGWGEPEDIRRSMDAGFEAHLVKPLKLHELQDILARRME